MVEPPIQHHPLVNTLSHGHALYSLGLDENGRCLGFLGVHRDPCETRLVQS